MKSVTIFAMVVGGIALVAAVGWPVSARAAQAQGKTAATDQSMPKSWNWEIKDGKRVPKGNRQVNADGSWREEIRQGKCVTVKEKSPAGEYKETRKCD